MRITAGMARGIPLLSPKGETIRPATDAARQAIFSSLGDGIVGARVLDLFAGTGSYGLEALSRGALSAMFVENNHRTFGILQKNISSTSASIKAFRKNFYVNAIERDCFKSTTSLGSYSFDFAFIDPPYAMLRYSETLSKIMNMLCQIRPSISILEAPAEFLLPREYHSGVLNSEFTFELVKRIGKSTRGKPTHLIFKIEKSENPDAVQARM